MEIKKKALGFGIDFLKVCIPSGKEEPILDSMFWGFSDNSNIGVANFFGFPFDCMFKENGNKDLLFLQINGDPLVCIEKIKDIGIHKKYSYFVLFYGLFFCVPEAKKSLEKFLDRFDYGVVTRVDLALDLPISTTDFLNAGYTTKFQKTTSFGVNEKKQTVETKYFGQKNSTNKKHFIRVYDKLLDTQKKHKMMYYYDYLEYNDVCRVEVQVNSNSCKRYRIKPGNILSEDNQKNLFTTFCINPDGTNFKALEFFDFSAGMRIAPDRVEDRKSVLVLDKLKHAKVMLSYAKTLHSNGFDVLHYLERKLFPDLPNRDMFADEAKNAL